MGNYLIFLITDDNIKKFFNSYGYMFAERGFFSDIWRDIMFTFIFFVYHFVKGVTEFFYDIFTLDYFFNFAGINDLYNKLFILFAFISAISIVVSAIKNLSEMKVSEKSIFFSTFLSFIVIFSLPVAMNETGKMVDAVVEHYGGGTSTIDDVYKSCFVDLELNFVKQDFDLEKIDLKTPNELKVEDIQKIKINEILLDGRSPKHEMLKYRVKNEKGEVETLSKNGYFTPEILYSGYYRWHFSYGYGLVFMIITGLIYLKNSLALGEIYFDLASYKIIGGLIISTETDDDVKKKYVLREIFVGYISVLGIFLSMKVFSQLSFYINTLNVNAILKILLIIASVKSINKIVGFIGGAYGVNSSSGSGLGMFRAMFLLREAGRLKDRLFNNSEYDNNTNNNDNTNDSNNNQNSNISKNNYNSYDDNDDYDDYDSKSDKENYENWGKEDNDDYDDFNNNFDDNDDYDDFNDDFEEGEY